MKPHEVAQLLGIAVSTVRTWSLSEFKPYLSPTAQGGENRRRDFTDRDIQIIAHIASMSHRSMPRDEMHDELRRLQADDWRNLPPLPEAPPNTVPVPVMPTATAQLALEIERRNLQEKIAGMQGMIDELKADLASARADKEAILRELATLTGEIERQKLMVELYESGRLKPKGAE